MDPIIARKTWRTVEPLHMMIYFAPEAFDAYGELGVTDWPAGYFGSRSAALGVVAPEVVIATFFNFHPALVRRSLAVVWEATTPEAMLDARTSAADRALRRLLGDDGVTSSEMAAVAELTRRAADAACDHVVGRPLFAAHAALPWPDEPHLVAWHAQTLLREFRGDGHIAALVSHGVGPLEALILHAATGEVNDDALRSSRAWPEHDWNAAVERLRSHGLLAPGPSIAFTDAGREERDRIEHATDVTALAAYENLGEEACEQLRAIARPFSRRIVEGGALAGTPLNAPGQ
ncbi:MAG TPA: hypothetical protein VI916_03595 [Acidimicrobiia bacterium]|nr:hypothetical protein [Acidimicrobiia bacterium]